MIARELIALLPCHSLSDFPYHYEGQAASDLLACYTSLWHPALIAQAGRMPRWMSAYHGTEQLAEKLVVLPRSCRDDLPGYWTDEAQSQGAMVLESDGSQSRDVLAQRGAELLGRALPEVDRSVLADFYALGLCHLLVELLTVQMRYTTLLDEDHFSGQLVSAAEGALAGDGGPAHDRLAACYDTLAQSRAHFYPVDAYLVDLTLVAPTTIGAALRQQLQSGVPTSLLLSGAVAAEIAEREPATLAAIREAIAAGEASVVGGEQCETALPLEPIEDVLANFQRGLATYQECFEVRPRVFGRRRFGLSPRLPQMFEKLGFEGALHLTLDDGRFPQARQGFARWQTEGDSSTEALFRVPLDASLTESIFALPEHMSNSMDRDHVAVVAFAHWPGQTSPWFEDLKRTAAYGAPIGRFVTADTLFSEVESPGNPERFSADEYRSPYLTQDVSAGVPNPISQVANAHAAAAGRQATSTIDTLTALVRSGASAPNASAPVEVEAAAREFAAALPRASGPQTAGYLIINPLSFARKVVVNAGSLERPPTVAAPVLFAGESGGQRQVLVDVPPLGYTWLGPVADGSWSVPDTRPLAEGLALRNEFFELSFNPRTGALQSLATPGRRGNRLSQQLALRTPGRRPQAGEPWSDPEVTAEYSTMQADSVEIGHAGPAAATMISRGQLLDAAGAAVARFVQTTRVERGAPVVWLDIELEPLVELAAEPWNHYFAARFAWAEPAIEIYRDVGQVTEATSLRRIESPLYVDVRGAHGRLAILAGGFPYHRRVDDLRLDTLLIVRGETARRFRLGIAVDHTHPQHSALELLNRPMVVSETAAPPMPPTAWLLHVDAKSVVTTNVQPRFDSGRLVGVRLRMIETAGKACRCGLHACRPIVAARLLDLLGQPASELQPEADKVIILMSAGEWTQVELDF